MIKKFLKYILAGLLFSTAMISCSRPKTIPDDKLSNIFRDMFLVDAYADRYRITADIMLLDSLDLYGPIFEKYGYTAQDFSHTLNEFTKRKSVRLRDILDGAIAKLDDQYKAYLKTRRYLDFVDSAAMVLTRREIYVDSLITLKKLSDTTRLIINLPAENGQYTIEYYYTLDSIDRNRGFQNTFALVNDRGQKLNHRTLRMNAASERTQQTLTLDSSEFADSLMIRFAGITPDRINEKRTKPNLTIDSLVISHTPPIEQAREVLLRSLPVNRTILDSISYGLYPQKDSITLRIVPPLAREGGDPVAVQGGETAVGGDHR